MSGTGKSSVVEELVARRYNAVDTDDGWCEPLATLVERLATRTNNPFGKAPEELDRFLDDVEAVEPLLRRVASHEIRTTALLNEVVTAILRLVST